MNREIENLMHLIQASPSPFHTILECEKQLQEIHAVKLDKAAKWTLSPGNIYYTNLYDTTLIAFRVNAGYQAGDGVRIAASHTDWPCLRIKPSAETVTGSYAKLNVEVYGGPILNTWLDRPLSVAGKVVLKGDDPFRPRICYVDFARPILTIPNLAIHMNREVNKGVELNRQTDMLPLAGMVQETLEKDQFFMNALAAELSADPSSILGYDLCIYNAEAPCLTGLKEEFLSGPRLDNLTSVQACLSGLLRSGRERGIDVIAMFDNEEVGNMTKQGAPVFKHVLERISLGLGLSREEHLQAMMDSFMVSADVGHAVHPNKPELNDITNKNYLNEGFLIKMACSQSYATDCEADGIVEGLCLKYGIPFGKFLNRSDLRGGSTLGSFSSSDLSMMTADVGVPLLAMHSARELMGVKDQEALTCMIEKVFSE